MEVYTLSNKERLIMKVLWNSDKGLTAVNICEIDPSLNINTVQASLKKLLKKNFISVEDIVYSGTVLTRSYIAHITSDEYMSTQLQEHYNSCKKGSLPKMVSYFLDTSTEKKEILDELEKLIDHEKKKR